MTIFGAILFASVILTSCEGSSSEEPATTTEESGNSNQSGNKVEDPNSSPESVMNTIFQAAQSGEVGVLKSLLPPFDEKTGEIPCDGDCLALCNPGNESMKEELGSNYTTLADFKEYFSNGKIVGSPTINGNEAEVNFLFGSNQDRNETMNMQMINGKWYLSSF